MRVRDIDHIVLPVRDLEKARDAYRKLGFTVAPTAHHPFGTANAVIQLGNAYLELLTVEDAAKIPDPSAETFSFAAFNRDFLAHREGFSMVALTSVDAEADTEEFRAAKLATYGPVSFERDATMPDGTNKRLGFSLAFATEPRLTEAGFFTCRHHHRENFWHQRYQRHDNGALRLEGVVLVASDPADFHEFLTHFTGQHDIHASSAGVGFPLPDSRIDVLSPAACRMFYGIEADGRPPRFVLYRIAVADLAAVRARLDEAGIAFNGRRNGVVVPDFFGTAIVFE